MNSKSEIKDTQKPEGIDKKEFIRQLKGQERVSNSQTIAENMDN